MMTMVDEDAAGHCAHSSAPGLQHEHELQGLEVDRGPHLDVLLRSRSRRRTSRDTCPISMSGGYSPGWPVDLVALA